MHIKVRHVLSLLFLLTAGLLGAALFAANVQFQPAGVPLAKREAYERKLQAIREQEALLDKRENSPSAAKAVVSESSFDFGIVDPHSTVSHAFVIRNEGTGDLVLSKGETSCKCTVGEISNSLVPPGESAEVLVTWNTGYQSDDYTQMAMVKTNDPAYPTLELKIQGTVRTDLAFTTAELILPSVTPNNESKGSNFLYSQLYDDFTVDDVQCDLPGFNWTAEPADVEQLPEGDLQAKSAWKLTFFATPTTHGKYVAKATVSITSATGETVTRELTAGGTTLKSISFKAPDIDMDRGLDLGLMRNDQDRSKSVVVKVRDQGDRKIEVLDIKPEQLRAELTRTNQEGAYRLTITAPQGSAPGAFNLQSSHGYVQVGDPTDKNFTNWLPLTGVIIDMKTEMKAGAR